MNVIIDPEDEAFNEIERQANMRKESVTASINPYRDQVIEEVVQAILKMEGFGKDTLHSFAIYIRGLK
jgi:CHASE3 domain sensor protein